MIWETGCTLIVMLGLEREKDKVKVDRYWPLNQGDEEYHQFIRVRLIEFKRFEDGAITRRILEVQHTAVRIAHTQSPPPPTPSS